MCVSLFIYNWGYHPGSYMNIYIWGFPKITGTLLGVPIIRTIIFWGLYWGSLILGNYHIYTHTHTHNKKSNPIVLPLAALSKLITFLNSRSPVMSST